MLLLRSVLIACLGFAAAESHALAQKPADLEFDQTHRVLTELLSEHVHGDRFDYKALLADRSKLDQYLGSLQGVTREEFERWTKEQRCAFWIDAYNAFTLHLVAKNYPLESIKDLGGLFKSPWDKPFIPLGHLYPDAPRKELSLNDIENGILRAKFKDARIHAAIHRASRGSAPLAAAAFVGAQLGSQLDAQVRAWLADTTRNRFEREKRRAQVSEVFKWYEQDFARDAGSVREWLAKYAPAEHAEWLRAADTTVDLGYLEFSWKLNDVERPKH